MVLCSFFELQETLKLQGQYRSMINSHHPATNSDSDQFFRWSRTLASREEEKDDEDTANARRDCTACKMIRRASSTPVRHKGL